MRGKLNIMKYLIALNRIPPAGAGKTTYSANYQCASKDHPRRCGENVYRVSITFNVPGSPPQVRGKLLAPYTAFESERITPAGAGKTPINNHLCTCF